MASPPSPPGQSPYRSPAEGAAKAARLTITALSRMQAAGEKIAMLTAYDASFAAACERAGVDVLLVGDSLGMVVQGHRSTLPVTLEHTLYHTRAVINGCARPLVIADLPFGTFQRSREAAYDASCAALQAGAQMIKIEGGGWIAETIAFLVTRGVPVCAHVGLQPQLVNVLGGYRVHGRDAESARTLVADARALADAGASLLVVECVPSEVGAAITREVPIPTIGIGAGRDCSGQVLVIYDALGITPGKPARFVRNFLPGHDSIEAALGAYVAAVKDGSFPGPEHVF